MSTQNGKERQSHGWTSPASALQSLSQLLVILISWSLFNQSPLRSGSDGSFHSKKNISRFKLCIHNPHKLSIIFKIQTTHPEELRARPNVGLIEPDQEMIVNCEFSERELSLFQLRRAQKDAKKVGHGWHLYALLPHSSEFWLPFHLPVSILTLFIPGAFPSKISSQTEKSRKKQLAPRKYKIQTITCEDSNLFSLERFEEREVKLRDIFEALMKEKESKPITARLKDFFRGGSDEKRGHVNFVVFDADRLSTGILLKVSGSNVEKREDSHQEDRRSRNESKDDWTLSETQGRASLASKTMRTGSSKNQRDEKDADAITNKWLIWMYKWMHDESQLCLVVLFIYREVPLSLALFSKASIILPAILSKVLLATAP